MPKLYPPSLSVKFLATMSITLQMFGGQNVQEYAQGESGLVASGAGVPVKSDRKLINPGAVFIQKQYRTQTYYRVPVAGSLDRRDPVSFIQPTSGRDRYFEGLFRNRSNIVAAQEAAQVRMRPC